MGFKRFSLDAMALPMASVQLQSWYKMVTTEQQKPIHSTTATREGPIRSTFPQAQPQVKGSMATSL